MLPGDLAPTCPAKIGIDMDSKSTGGRWLQISSKDSRSSKSSTISHSIFISRGNQDCFHPQDPQDPDCSLAEALQEYHVCLRDPRFPSHGGGGSYRILSPLPSFLKEVVTKTPMRPNPLTVSTCK